jgi:hypothetical protein
MGLGDLGKKVNLTINFIYLPTLYFHALLSVPNYIGPQKRNRIIINEMQIIAKIINSVPDFSESTLGVNK